MHRCCQATGWQHGAVAYGAHCALRLDQKTMPRGAQVAPHELRAVCGQDGHAGLIQRYLQCIVLENFDERVAQARDMLIRWNTPDQRYRIHIGAGILQETANELCERPHEQRGSLATSPHTGQRNVPGFFIEYSIRSFHRC